MGKKNILIIGGAGYIGGHAVLGIQDNDAGYPIIYDNLSTGYQRVVRDVPFVHADLADKAQLSETLQKYHIDACMHFAARSLVQESVQYPLKYYRNNIVNTINLIEAMVDTGVKHLIFSSTAAVYGEPQCVPMTEDHPLLPKNPYGWSKMMIERILLDASITHGLHIMSFRYFNAAGADARARMGEHHTPETHLIPLVVEAAYGDRECIDIFGTDYGTPDGTCIRDYIHVEDIISAHLLGLQMVFCSPPGYSVYNLGIGQGFSVREVIRCVEKLAGKKIPIRELSRRSGDPACLIADAHRVQKTLHWSPQYIDLEGIITTVLRYYNTTRTKKAGER